MLFQLLENIYLRWKEFKDRPKHIFWPHEHLEYLRKLERMKGN